MTNTKTASSPLKDWAVAMLCLALVLGFLFRESFDDRKVLFSNDAPLGLISSKAGVDASTFDGIVTGYWHDLNWIGIEMPSVLPGLSWGMFQIFRTPINNAKFHVPLSLLYLGFCAWLLFRTLGFRQVVCVIGALAAMLNMDSFSHATWGLPSRALTQGSAMLAIAALYSANRGRSWIKAALAGMCVGMGIVEGFDVGALYSLHVAAFGLFIALAPNPKINGKAAGIGIARVAVVALCAGLFAAHALNVLVSTQLKGDGTSIRAEGQTPEQKWDWATSWSLPKAETLRVIIPGLFGYRMEGPEGSYYWGAVGYPNMQRHSGAGEYSGILVVLVGIFGVANAFRKKGMLYDTLERRAVVFWAVVAMISLFFAWGRWAPFYKIVYALPFLSTIRNPIKFMHFFQLALLILFAYGLELLFRNYLALAKEKSAGLMDGFKAWWAAAGSFDRKVIWGYAFGLGASLLGFLVYSSSRVQLEKYLPTVGFPEPYNREIAAFSFGEVGMYLVFYALSLAAILACLSGVIRARAAAILLGAVLVIDMSRANARWVKYEDYKAQYAPQGVIDLLAKAAPEYRVSTRIAPFSGAYFLAQNMDFMQGVFSEWSQRQFQFNNIQSLDIVQMPRTPELDAVFRNATMPMNQQFFRATRLWELSSTRYIIGQKEFLLEINDKFDPGKRRFQILTNFDAVPKPGVDPAKASALDINWDPVPNGRMSIFDFTGALPRYKLFSNWEQSLNDTNTIEKLMSPGFDPHSQVLISDESVSSAANGPANPGSATLVSYAPKKIKLKVDAAANSILLWNDRWAPNWKAFVDGQPVKLLRANFIMRGIQVPQGSHEVEMRYQQEANSLWISFATMAAGVLLVGFLVMDSRRKA